jgi:iron complex transport system ATP-binding protein
MGEPVDKLRFEDVSFGYEGRPVVEHLGFGVRAGELVGVIGPNGAGKSTVVRLALGLVRPSSGRIFLDGQPIERLGRRAFAKKVAAVMQEEALEFPFTVLEVVLMGRTAHLGPLGFERAEDLAAAREAMAETGVESLGARPLDALSGGERKRVLLARAFAQRPELIILDEPAAALDIHHQIAIFDLLADKRHNGVAVMVVVHDLNLAAAYCDRLLLLQSGAPAVLGTVEEILTYRRVREVFGVEVYVGVNELTGARFLLPMSERVRPRPG